MKKQFSFSFSAGMYYSFNNSGLHDVIIVDYVIGNDDAPGCCKCLIQQELLAHRSCSWWKFLQAFGKGCCDTFEDNIRTLCCIDCSM